VPKTQGKIGRNELCPCGSGKKYKRCCLADMTNSARLRENPDPTAPSSVTTQFQIPAFAGEASVLTVVPAFATGDPRNTNDPKGQAGRYQVTFVLSRPGRSELPERTFNASERLAGNSHIAIAPPALTSGKVSIRVRTQTPAGNFTFDGKPNLLGYLGKIVSEPFEAQSFDDALRRAYQTLAPALSNWSIHLDVPVYTSQIDAVEARTGAISMQLVIPPLEVSLAVEGEPKLEPEFLHYAGLYREALNSNSPAYRFLCFFKIIEGIRQRRKRLALDARLSNREPDHFVLETIPCDSESTGPWLNSLYGNRNWDARSVDQVLPAEVRGERFGRMIQSKLEPLRNQVAHGILDSGEPGMSIDDMFKIETVNFWLPLTRTIVRRMLKNTFPTQFMAHMEDPQNGPS